MTERQRRWFYRTRDPEFLWKLGICIVLAGFLLAWVAEGLAQVSGFRKSKENAAQAFTGIFQGTATPGDILGFFEALHHLAKEDYESFLPALGQIHYSLGDSVPDFMPGASPRPETHIPMTTLTGAYAEARAKVESWDLPAEREELALLFWDALGEIPAEGAANDDAPLGPRATELKARAEAPGAPRYTNWAYAIYSARKQDKYTMYAALEREGRAFPEAKRARERLLNGYLRDDPESAERLLNDPLFADQVTPTTRVMSAVNRKAWVDVFWLIPPASFQRFDAADAALALLAGLIWFTILLRTIHTPRILHRRTGLALLAVLLGVISVWPTLWLVYWQTHGLGLSEDPMDLLQNLKFFIAGVGLREEVCKLLLFLPLGIYLARDGDGPEILVLAGCVGLGFAIKENMTYFAGDLSAVTVGRFLTANVMHITMTGILGLSLCRALRHPMAIGDFLGTFTLIVIAHGLYDAFISTMVLVEWALVSMIIMVGLTYYYFQQITTLRQSDGSRMIYSLSSIFIGGLALIFSSTLVVLAFRYSAVAASVSMYFGALSNALLIIVYLRQFKEVRT